MSDRLYVDFHILQTVPPSCVNRDDTGSPKTAFYGGTQRARVSSQAWKRAMRVYFKDIFKEEALGKRTKKFVEMVAQIITQKDSTITEENAAELAKAAMDKALKKDKKGGDSDNKKDALLFLNDTQANAIADLALAENAGEKVDAKAYKAAIKELPSVDMVLFGRMVPATRRSTMMQRRRWRTASLHTRHRSSSTILRRWTTSRPRITRVRATSARSSITRPRCTAMRRSMCMSWRSS